MTSEEVGHAVRAYVLELVPPALRETPQCIVLVNNMSVALAAITAAAKTFDGGPESAARLAFAAGAYCSALARISEWGREVRAAADEARGATAH